MPLDDRLAGDLDAEALYNELSRRVRQWMSRVDHFFYNVGTGVSLAASGAAAVVAPHNATVGAALAAVATFFIAIAQILGFGRRWHWTLERSRQYRDLIVGLNTAAALSGDGRAARIDEVRKAMLTVSESDYVAYRPNPS